MRFVRKGGLIKMDNDKENILKLFKSGATIKGLTDMIYSQQKALNKEKKSSDKAKISLKDIRGMVEQTIYEYQMGRVKM
jgi:hypothetical protein